MSSTATQNAGDALRELDAQNQVRSDPFVLVSGDVVSNVDLRRVVALHSERRRKDKSCIMTMLMKRAAPDHRTRSLGEDLVVAYNKRTGQLLPVRPDLRWWYFYGYCHFDRSFGSGWYNFDGFLNHGVGVLELPPDGIVRF